MARGKGRSTHSPGDPHYSSISKPEKKAAWFEAPPLAKFTLVAGILCALGLAALGYLSPLHYLSTFNETQMKLVFSNEDNTTWAIVCRESKSYTPISEDFQRVEKDKNFRNTVKFGVLDCGADVLRTGKTVNVISEHYLIDHEQFNFKILEHPLPTIFVVGGGIKDPIVIPSKSAGSSAGIVSWLKDTLNPRPRVVSSTTDLTNRCLHHESCVMVLKPGCGFRDSAKEALRETIKLHRSVRFVTMDAMSYETTIHARLKVSEMQVNPEHSIAAIHFRQLEKSKKYEKSSSEAGRKPSISWEATAYTADDTENWISGFNGWVAEVHGMNRKEEMDRPNTTKRKVITVSTPPTVQKRKKKTVGEGKRTKKKKETVEEREAREERERVQELIRQNQEVRVKKQTLQIDTVQKPHLAQRKKMDEEAEAFVIENEEVMHDDDGPGGDDEMNYVEEDTSVNTEEECDEEEIVVEL